MRFRPVLLVLLLVLTLLGGRASLAQTLIYPKTEQRFVSLGQGDPTVVFLYGLASSLTEWMPVVRRVSAQSRVFIYDRRGYGGAPVIGTLRGSKVIADELHVMLDDLNVAGPYILVGHSLGALYAQTFARLYPEDTAGILLVDPSVEQLDRFMMGEDEATAMPLMTLVMNAGAKAEYRGRRAAITDRDAADPLPEDIPVTVLSAGANMRGGYQDLQEQVTNLQALMSADSRLGRHVVVSGAGHNIHREAPHAVELEVARLVALYRAEAGDDSGS